MDYAALYAELANDPEGIGYAGKSDAERAALLNAPTRDGWRDVTVGEIAGYALLNLAWPGIEAAAESQDAQVRAVARSALALMTNPAIQTVELSKADKRAAFTALLDVLVAAGAITAGHKAGVLALGQIKISRAQELGFGHVQIQDIINAEIVHGGR